MGLRGFLVILLCAAQALSALSAVAGRIRVTVPFNIIIGTAPGENVFVVESSPEPEQWDPVRALKRIPANRSPDGSISWPAIGESSEPESKPWSDSPDQVSG